MPRNKLLIKKICEIFDYDMDDLNENMKLYEICDFINYNIIVYKYDKNKTISEMQILASNSKKSNYKNTLRFTAINKYFAGLMYYRNNSLITKRPTQEPKTEIMGVWFDILKKYKIFGSYLDKLYNDCSSLKQLLNILFSYYFGVISDVEDIQDNETDLFEESSRCAIIHTEKEYKMRDKFYQYDSNGFFLNIFQNLKFGVGEATETKEYKHGDVGIYQISYDSKALPNYMRNSTFSTNYDLQYFEKMKIDYKIIKGIKYLKYIEISDFKNLPEIIKELYNTKHTTTNINDKNEIKQTLASFWGNLSMTNIKQLTLTEIQKGDEVIGHDINTNLYSVKLGCFRNCYAFGYFRIKAFIQSYARLQMINIIRKIEKKYTVIKIKTDSILCDVPPEKFNKKYCKISDEFGKFKIEAEFEKGSILINSKNILKPN